MIKNLIKKFALLGAFVSLTVSSVWAAEPETENITLMASETVEITTGEAVAMKWVATPDELAGERLDVKVERLVDSSAKVTITANGTAAAAKPAVIALYGDNELVKTISVTITEKVDKNYLAENTADTSHSVVNPKDAIIVHAGSTWTYTTVTKGKNWTISKANGTYKSYNLQSFDKYFTIGGTTSSGTDTRNLKSNADGTTTFTVTGKDSAGTKALILSIKNNGAEVMQVQIIVDQSVEDIKVKKGETIRRTGSYNDSDTSRRWAVNRHFNRAGSSGVVTLSLKKNDTTEFSEQGYQYASKYPDFPYSTTDWQSNFIADMTMNMVGSDTILIARCQNNNDTSLSTMYQYNVFVFDEKKDGIDCKAGDVITDKEFTSEKEGAWEAISSNPTIVTVTEAGWTGTSFTPEIRALKEGEATLTVKNNFITYTVAVTVAKGKEIKNISIEKGGEAYVDNTIAGGKSASSDAEGVATIKLDGATQATITGVAAGDALCTVYDGGSNPIYEYDVKVFETASASALVVTGKTATVSLTSAKPAVWTAVADNETVVQVVTPSSGEATDSFSLQLKGLKAGSTTVRVENDYVRYAVAVTVSGDVRKMDLAVETGKTVTTNLTFGSAVYWVAAPASGDDADVMTVSVREKEKTAAMTATITTLRPGLSQWTVYVKESENGELIPAYAMSVKVWEAVGFSIGMQPGESVTTNLTSAAQDSWTAESSAPAVATVMATGASSTEFAPTITALADGEATITAKNGYAVYKIQVEVRTIVPVPVPTAVTGLAYDGNARTGVVEDVGFTLTGNVATNAGTYEAWATLADGYIWADGTTHETNVAWSIGYAKAAVTGVSTNKLVGTSDPKFTATVTGTFGDDEIAYTVGRTNTEAQTVGTYAGVIVPTGDITQNNYTVTYVAGNFEIRTGAITVTTNGVTRGYDDLDAALGDFERHGGTAVLHGDLGGRQITLPENGVVQSAEQLSTADDFKEPEPYSRITETRIADAWEYALAKLTPVEVPTAETLAYTGLEQTGVVAKAGFTLTGNVATDVGAYTARATPADGYCWPDDTTHPTNIAWSIGRAQATVTAVSTNKLFGAETPEFTTRAEGFYDGDDVTLTWKVWCESNDLTRVGTYALLVTGEVRQASYDITYVNGTFEILRGDMTVTTNGVRRDCNDFSAALAAMTAAGGGTAFFNRDVTAGGCAFKQGSTLAVNADGSWSTDGTLTLAGDIFAGTEVTASNVVLAADVTVGATEEETDELAVLTFRELDVGDYKLALTTNGVVHSMNATPLDIKTVFAAPSSVYDIVENTIDGGYEYVLEFHGFTLSFDPKGGSAVDPIVAAAGDTVEGPADPTKTGYAFAAWTTNGVTVSFPLTMPAEDFTLFAAWEANDYTLTYKPGEGTGDDVVSNMVYDVEYEVADCTFAKDGYSFVNWTNEEGVAYLPGQAITNLATGGNVDFTAVWTANVHTVTFDPANGEEPFSIAAACDDPIIAPKNPKRRLYAFTGWFEGDDEFTFPATMPAHDVALTAHWDPKQGAPEKPWTVGPEDNPDAVKAYVDPELGTVVLELNGTNELDLVALTNGLVQAGEEKMVGSTDFNATVKAGEGEFMTPAGWLDADDPNEFAKTLAEALEGGLTSVLVREDEPPAEIIEKTEIEVEPGVSNTVKAVIANDPSGVGSNAIQAVAVEGLIDIAGKENTNVTLTVTAMTEEAVEKGGSGAVLKLAAANTNDLEGVVGYRAAYVDLSVFYGESAEPVTNLNSLIAIHVAWPIGPQYTYRASRIHGDEEEAEAIPLAPAKNADGEYFETGNGEIIFHLKRFSTYSIAEIECSAKYVVTVDNFAKDLHAEDPKFTFSVEARGDDCEKGDIRGYCRRTPGEAPGAYAVNFVCTRMPEGLRDGDIAVRPGTLTIRPGQMLPADGTVTRPKPAEGSIYLKANASATWKATPKTGCAFVKWELAADAGEGAKAAYSAVTPANLAKTSLTLKIAKGAQVRPDEIVATWRRLDEDVPAGQVAVMLWSEEAKGTTKGTGLYKLAKDKKTGVWSKKVSISATAKANFVFAGWYEDPGFSVPATFTDGKKAKDHRTASQSITVTADAYLFARFVEKTTKADPITHLRYAGAGYAGDDPASETWHVGVALPTNGCAIAFGSASLPTVTVKNLPAGVKFDKATNRFTGIPTKAGVFNVQVTVKNASAATDILTVPVTVEEVPAWAQGTYDGAVVENGVTNGTVTLTVSSKGAVSGTVRKAVGGKELKLTLKAASFAGYADGVYALAPAFTTNKVTETVAFALAANERDMRLGVAGSDDGTMVLLQNAFKNALTKTDFAGEFKTARTLTLESGIKLTVKKGGAVTIAGSVLGTDGAKRVAVSGSAQAIWVPETEGYAVVVYVAPKKNLKTGICEIVEINEEE